MNLISVRANDPQGFADEILKFYNQSPESALANYWMGCLSWSQSAAAPAQGYFAKALAKSPQDHRFSETVQKASAGVTADKVCSVQIGFDPEGF